MAPRDKTDVSINGERTTLVFGDYYRVRYGKDSAIIEDGRLESRANNGDLVFSVPPYGIGGIAITKRRVRPSAIDAIFGSGVEHTPSGDELEAELARQKESDRLVEEFVAEGDQDPDSVAAKVHAELGPIIPDRLEGETGAAYLARLERVMGASYVRWVGTETGQAAIESVAREERAARKVVPIGEAKTAKLAKTSHPAGVPGTRLLRAASAKSRATKETLDDRLAREVDAALDPALPAAILAGAIRTGKAYADRNQVWKCGTCKKRTRRPECVGTTDAPHPAVSAPAGKRLADRLGDR